MRTCTIDGCEKKHCAKGLCKPHYNGLIDTDRHRKVTVPCAACGEPCRKEPGAQYARRYCDLMCRDYDRCGPRSSVWPRPIPRIPKVKPAPFMHEARDCAWCGDGFTARRADHLMCTERCVKRAKKARRRAREAGAPGTYTWAEVITLYIRFDRCCAYCLQRTDAPEPDHVLALKRGGSNSITNILPSCHVCNGDKRELTLDEWAIDRARRGLPAMPTWSLDDRRYWHLTTARAYAA